MADLHEYTPTKDSAKESREKTFTRATSLLRAPTFTRGKTEIFAETAQLERTATLLGKDDGNSEDGEPVKSCLDSDSDYDTDLEDIEAIHTPHDQYGLRTYGRTCRKLGIVPLRQISNALKKTEMVLKNRVLSPSEVLAICNALLDNDSVCTLCFDGNKIGDKGAMYIAYLVSETDCSISTLLLPRNNIRSAGMSELASTILYSKILTQVDVSGNNIGDADILGFVEILKVNRTLTHLNLSHNSIGDKGARRLGVAIALNESLRLLDVSWNQIREAGGLAICYSIKENILLKTFDVSMNGISNAGAYALGQALRHNRSLTELDLSYNRVHDEGIERLIKGLKVNDTLRVLKMKCNPISTKAATTLLTTVRDNVNSALELIDVSTVPLYVKGLDVIDEINIRNPDFQYLYATVVQKESKERQRAGGITIKDPHTVMREYMDSKGMRLVDFFRQFNADGGGSITRAQFKEGMKYIEVPLTESQLDDLITGLDKSGDGKVNLGELVAGDRQYRRKQLKKKMANA